jgi:acetyl/propionyl-CoA carboxylase alpha subunit
MRLRCGEVLFEAHVREGRSGFEVSLGARSFRVVIEDGGPGVFHLRDGSLTRTFHVARDGEAVHLFWEGVVYRLDEESEGGRKAARADLGALEAPMPGRVIAVRVAPGQRVDRGQELLVVEAMKMENALRAPRDGIVRAVHAKAGDMVAPGVALVEIGDDPGAATAGHAGRAE